MPTSHRAYLGHVRSIRFVVVVVLVVEHDFSVAVAEFISRSHDFAALTIGRLHLCIALHLQPPVDVRRGRDRDWKRPGGKTNSAVATPADPRSQGGADRYSGVHVPVRVGDRPDARAASLLPSRACGDNVAAPTC